jgi:regulator of sigma E protease
MFQSLGLTSLAVIPVLGFLIFVHELGHFLAARWMGVKVLEFGFGYPPRLVKLFERNGVEYTLNWLPFGGFVRMAGEDGSFDSEGSLAAAAPWRRIVVLFAGPFMNLLTAAILFAVLLWAGTPQFVGDAATLPVEILAVSPGSPAEQTGLRVGDVIEAMNGQVVRGAEAVSAAIRANAGQEVTIVVHRQDETLTLVLIPRRPEETPAGQGAAGIQIGPVIPPEAIETVRANPIAAIVGGVQRTVFLIGQMLGGLGMLLRSAVSPSVDMPEGGVGGLVAIGRITAEVAREGWKDLLSLTAFLSVNLAILNLLPIPALDGGRIMFALLEMARRKRIPPEKEAMVHLAGFAVLIALMVLITFVDVSNWLAGRPALPGG